MREPSDLWEAFQWWRDAIEGRRGPVDVDNPQPGFYRTRLRRDGPFVGAAIFIQQAIDAETGELTEPERLVCVVNGRERDVWTSEVWTFLSADPIPEEEYRFLIANAKWAEEHSPAHPMAKPHKPTSLLSIPPIFD